MDSYKKYKNATMTEGKTPFEHLKKNVYHSKRHELANSMNYMSDGIGVIEQKTANKYQTIFKADDSNYREFRKGLKADETLVRVSTPLTSAKNKLNRSIAKINLKTGKIAFIDSDAYEQGEIKWERPLMAKYINIVSDELSYFNVY